MAVLYQQPDDKKGYFRLTSNGQTEIWMDIERELKQLGCGWTDYSGSID